MAYLHCDFHSNELGMMTAMAVILPDTGPLEEAPVIYLLHGLGDNCSGWTRLTAVERYARDHGAAVIMPEVQRSFYTDMALGPNYFSFVQKELPTVCRRMFGLSAKREKNFIMGLSMGGYGAMKCALTAPEQYAGCASFSAVTELEARIERCDVMGQEEFRAIFGPELQIPPQAELSSLLAQRDKAELPRFFMTCGEQDLLYPENCRMAEKLQEKGAALRFLHWPGDHTWDFWDKSVAMAMEEFL